MIFLIQLLANAFVFTMAIMHAAAISQFETYGSQVVGMTRFHRYGVWVRLLFLVACGLFIFAWEFPRYHFLALLHGVAAGLICYLWVYLWFDIVTNEYRIPERKWYYLGDNDADGRRWQRWFGEDAGKKKAVFLIVLIVVTNIFYLVFLQ